MIQMRVAIIGAAISGPAAALALKKAGHGVTVYERRQQADIWSASTIVMAHTTSEILSRLGFADSLRVHVDLGVTVDRAQIIDAKADTYSPAFDNVVWGDLHMALTDMATKAGAQFFYGTDGGEARAENYDVVIHASGISHAAQHTIGTPLGYTAFRATTDKCLPVGRFEIRDPGRWMLHLWSLNFGSKPRDLTHWVLFARDPDKSLRTQTLTTERQAWLHEYVSQVMPAEYAEYLSPYHTVTDIQAAPLSEWHMPLSFTRTDEHGTRHIAIGDAIAPVSPHTGMGANLGILEAFGLPAALHSPLGQERWIHTTRRHREHWLKVSRQRVAYFMGQEVA